MERLTVKIKNRVGVIWAAPSETTAEAALTRLAAYEDTGLEPEEVAELVSPKTVEIARLLEKMCTEGSAQHMLELFQAEKDGRLVVLNEPRKPLVWGDDSHNTILCPNCNHDLMGGFREDEYCEKDMYQCPYCGQSIGSTKVMTREEAEAALKKREEADNEAIDLR